MRNENVSKLNSEAAATETPFVCSQRQPPLTTPLCAID